MTVVVGSVIFGGMRDDEVGPGFADQVDDLLARRQVRSQFRGAIVEAVAEAALTPDDAQRCRRIFTEHQQLELSACILGANPNAVARAWKERAVTDADLYTGCGGNKYKHSATDQHAN